MISNNVTITSTTVEVVPAGINKILGFQGKMIIPLSHITEISIEYGLMEEGKVWRLRGTSFFSKSVGLFSNKGVKFYVNIKKKEEPLLLTLKQERYTQLLLGVEEAHVIIDKIKDQDPLIKVSNLKMHKYKENKSAKASQLMHNSLIILGGLVLFLMLIGTLLQSVFPSVAEEFIVAEIVLAIIGVIFVFILFGIRIKNSKKFDKKEK